MADLTRLSPPPFEYEAELQRWLAAHPGALEAGLWVVGYEFPLGENRADLVAVDSEGRLVVIEVKRANATREAVAQVLDYVSALEVMEVEEIADIVNDAEARPEFARVVDFERELVGRYPGVEASNLVPVRALLACTSESPETRRMLRFLQGRGMKIDRVVFEGALAENGKRTYRRKQPTRADCTGTDEAADRPRQIAVDEVGAREPCRAVFPKAGTKKRRKIEQIHQRAEEYLGADLFRSIHCMLVHTLPDAHEIPREERDPYGQLSCGIAFDMRSTSEDEERNGRLEYVVIRLYPEFRPEAVMIGLFDSALRRSGGAISLLAELNEYHPFGGNNVKGEDFDSAWITSETWPTDRPILEQVLRAIHEGWEAERRRGGR